MKKFLTIFMILLFAVLVSACKPNHGLTIADADKDLQMVLGDTYTVTPTLNVKADVLTWTSGDEEVVTVANGAIEAVGVGSTTITVVIDGTTVSETIDVTVSYAAATSVTVAGAGNVVIGGELQLTGTVVPANASQALTWASSNNSVATVNNGVVTGVAVGTVTITATATGTSISKTANVTVVAPDPTGITVTGANEVNVGANSTFTATVAPTLASQEVTWSVDHPEFATIDATTGELTGVAEGTVVVTATSVAKNTVAGTKTVTIILPTPTSVAIEGTGLLSIGATSSNYSATISPAGAVQTATWSVNNPSIATINETSGVLTPISAGTVTITATSTVLNTVKATLTVVVYSNEFLVVDDGYTSLTLGTKVTLGTKDYYYGYTAFANTSDLTGILVDGSNVELKDGTYSGNVTVDKNNVKFFGKGTMTGVMSVSENVSG
ncbi:MAG: Ig-like domain-containing protein, partial [Bacilli bacterium]|nr:Ig-like domain-containing protein [Bacilli bacterium]